MSERSGRILLLNGASSSGKTSIARELQRVLAEAYLQVSLDSFLLQLPEHCLADNQYMSRALPGLLAGFNASNAGIVNAGNNVIIDHVLQEPSWVTQCVEAFKGIQVIFVGVHCSVEVLEIRESARDDRASGTARYQYERIHSHKIYDIEVDTSEMSLEECVAVIQSYLESGRQSMAFRTLSEQKL